MIALIHDWMNQMGGAEDVLSALHDLFPQAPVFTSIYDPARMPEAWRSWDIRSTWMDRLPSVHRRHQAYMPVFWWLWANRRIPAGHDLLLSNKSGFCLGARGATGSRHVCYCLTPTRFTYDFEAYAAREAIPAPAKPALRAMAALLRRWETRAAQRVTRFAAISREVQARITRLYGRDSDLIYPPVDVDRLRPSLAAARDDGFFLIVSRLLPYKRIDLAIEACGRLGLPLVVAGDGRDRDRLQGMAGSSVKFLGRVSDTELADLLSRCRAFLFPGLEDFGIAPLQAMAFGKPVVAFAGGGALDTVIEGKTGVLFNQQTPESLAQALQRLSEVRFAPDGIRAHAEAFSVARFRREILEILN